MRRRVSVAEAKNHLPALIHEVENSRRSVEITRRGKTVAVLLSSAAYERKKDNDGFVAGIARIRAKYGRAMGFTKGENATLRNRAAARDFSFDDPSP
ncbi:MAG TPA: type II toxin-antitoxin system Phd/YefM family antitoxin [Labilithrix sp.]|nr:type II toxin-antitoxin system Phd/YefM family antitoxin [Labilithrix sp.]